MASLTLEEQTQAIEMYSSKMSMQSVADHFGVSLGAVLYTLRHNRIPRRKPSENSAILFENKPLSYNLKEDLSREEQDLKLSAVMLYWAEGYKVGKSGIDFANSDPEMALIFRKFLSEICRVDEERIRCSIYCYEGQDVKALHEFWSNLLTVPQNQFIKPYIKEAAAPGPRGPRMLHGLVHIRYSDKKLLRQILVWIEEYKQKCVGIQAVNGYGL